MFDAETVALIGRAPALEDVDLADLPQRLTEAYANIVAARMRLRDGANGQLPERTAQTVTEMQRLAFTYEAFVSVLPGRNDRAAAAFVAGSAHQVSMLATSLRAGDHPQSALSIDSISPDVSSTLLFLIAEASADAAEIAKGIRWMGDDPVESALLEAIQQLAVGKLAQVLAVQLPNVAVITNTNRTNQGVRSLYYQILEGVRGLATTMLGQQAVDPDPFTRFDAVKALCIESVAVLDPNTPVPTSVFAGPFHLASLLSAVARDLVPSSMVRLLAPGGVDQDEWSEMMRGIARRRPYLWRNHRQAIESGYLEPGTSASVSFPTGAGKSTLAELKIAAALLRDLKVVFLAPTLALVDQTHRALATTFPNTDVQREREEDLDLGFDAEPLPTIAVMTPERCLALLSLNRDVFEGVGLLVFDECHLIHARQADTSRRAIDSMLCLLNFSAVCPQSDMLLLSAMMANATEIAEWIADLTSRRSIALALTWKPTRQVRGCVVYDANDITRLRTQLDQARVQFPNQAAPRAVTRELLVRPSGLFCLRQTWHLIARRSYALLPLLDSQVQLSTGTARDGQWYLTPNGNQVAAALASATGRQRLKTLVFTQTVTYANSVAKNVSDQLGDPHCQLNNQEQRLYSIAVDEAGGPERVYLDVEANTSVRSAGASHHSLLLPSERQLHESLFRRSDGINVLVATSTLAQGMNLPSEVVIIAGDSRFDPEANRLEQLEAYELLNAAGRAGRAGESANGFVLVVPSKVIHLDDAANRIHQYWGELRGIFAQSDQCLSIDDPLVALLDEIHVAAGPPSAMARYLVRRLPVAQPDDLDHDHDAKALLRRSLAAFRARVRNDQAWIDTRIESALAARQADPEAPAILNWADRLAASAGVPAAFLRAVGDSLEANPPAPDASLVEWREWMLQWLAAHPIFLPSLIRAESLESVFGGQYKRLTNDQERGAHVLPMVSVLLRRWMEGDTLAELEEQFGTRPNRIGKAEHARSFVLKVIPDLSYVFGLSGRVYRALVIDRGENLNYSNARDSLGPCVREGFDVPEKLGLRQVGRPASRRKVHRDFELIRRHLAVGRHDETRADMLGRVRAAVDAARLPE